MRSVTLSTGRLGAHAAAHLQVLDGVGHVEEAAMTLSTVIADTRTTVTEDPATAKVLFSAHGELTGVTEVEVRTPAHSFTVDETPALDLFRNPVPVDRTITVH
jgi:hypothetical protein